MTLNAKIMEERAEARAEGLAEGLAKGQAKGQEKERRQNIKAAVKMMRQLGVSDLEIYKRISENFDISEEVLIDYINEKN